jgi:hypothetical protein
MKYLRCRLRFSEDSIHPLHRAIVDREELARDYLCHWNTDGEGPDTFVFFVEGSRSVYEAELDATPLVVDHDVAPVEPGRFYAYVRQANREVDEAMFTAVSRTGAVVVPPVEFASDASAGLTVLGDADALQGVVDAVPEEVGFDVQRIGEYAGHPGTFDPELTERQREAVRAAVEAGYYATPRTGGVADVADRLGCAAATATEHLRKAEERVMATLVDAH